MLLGFVPAGVAALALTGGGGAGPAFSSTDLKLRMSDGVELAATIFEPAIEAPVPANRPAIMFLHGIGQTRLSREGASGTTANELAAVVAARGYVALTFDARAHGASGGLFTLDGPREIADVRELFEWLAARPDVDRHRIGAFGISYGGGAALRAAVEGVPFTTLVAMATWTDLARALFPQRLTKTGVVYGFSNSVPPERTDPALNALRDDLFNSRNLDALSDLMAARSTLKALGQITVPLFWLQGRRDFFVDIDQATAAFRRVRGPKRLYLGDFGHAPAPNPPEEQQHVADELAAWFDHWLKGAQNGIGTQPSVEVAPDPWTGKTTKYAGLPPVRVVRASFRGRTTMGADGKVVRTGRPLRTKLEAFGAPVVRVTASSATGWSHLVAVLTARTRGGDEILISEGGTSTAALGRKARTVTIRMLSEAAFVPARSRLRVTLAATSTAQNARNQLYLFGVAEKSTLKVGRVTLQLPVLKRPISG